MDAVNPLAQDANVNTGLKQRHAYTRESKSVDMEGRIHSDSPKTAIFLVLFQSRSSW